jgi:DNA-binding transcriptional LysR family regulator
MTLRRKLPSAQSLFAFESAARTLNFTTAGKAMNVTQPAISKNIAALEDHIGTQLFVRNKPGLTLTSDGEVFYRAIQLSFTALESALDQISRGNRKENTLTLSLTTSFSAHWLIPQMQAFREEFPDLTLNFQLTGGEAKGALRDCDLGLRHESEVAPQDHALNFAPEWLVAVASPDYIARNGTLDNPKPGSTHSLVKLASPRISWNTFLQKTNQKIDNGLPEIRVPDYSVVLQSALNGRGVALGYTTSCGYLLREGQLALALPNTLKTGKNYCLVTHENSPDLLIIERVRQWICEQSDRILKEVTPMLTVDT